MGAYYSIVRYLPDPSNGECLNAGVIVFDDDSVRAKFTDDWSRLARFGEGDVSFVKEFADDFDRDVEAGVLTSDRIKRMADGWSHSLRITPPSYAMLDVDRLLAFASRKFLPQRGESGTRGRTKAAAVKIAHDSLTKALAATLGDVPGRHLKRKSILQGRNLQHQFPLVVQNGRPMVGIDALSFEGNVNADSFTGSIKAVAFALEDVRNVASGIQTAVVVIKPPAPVSLYGQAVETFRDRGAVVVPSDEVDEWAKETIDRIKPHLR